MSLENSPARASASFSAPDASLTIGEFCRAEKISRSMRFSESARGHIFASLVPATLLSIRRKRGGTVRTIVPIPANVTGARQSVLWSRP